MPRVYNFYAKNAPSDAVYIGRPSQWGNPYVFEEKVWRRHPNKLVLVESRLEAIRLYALEILPKLNLAPLRGKDLWCFCAPEPCHGDVLLTMANL